MSNLITPQQQRVRTCGNCKYAEAMQGMLFCHRYPPQGQHLGYGNPPPAIAVPNHSPWTRVGEIAFFPMVQPQQWCGEHQAKPVANTN